MRARRCGRYDLHGAAAGSSVPLKSPTFTTTSRRVARQVAEKEKQKWLHGVGVFSLRLAGRASHGARPGSTASVRSQWSIRPKVEASGLVLPKLEQENVFIRWAVDVASSAICQQPQHQLRNTAQGDRRLRDVAQFFAYESRPGKWEGNGGVRFQRPYPSQSTAKVPRCRLKRVPRPFLQTALHAGLISTG